MVPTLIAVPATHEGPGAQGRTMSSEVSITLTVPSPWFTTNTNSPSVLITAQMGCDPTGIVLDHRIVNSGNFRNVVAAVVHNKNLVVSGIAGDHHRIQCRTAMDVV